MAKKDANKRLLIGVIIMMVGGALLLRNFGIWEEELNEFFFRWEMILIAVGVVSIISHEGSGPGFVILLIGAGFIARDYIEAFQKINFWQIFLGSIFIIAGIMVILNKKGANCKKCKGVHVERDIADLDYIDEFNFFGGGDRTIISNNFKGGKMLAIFGGSNFNLTRAKLAPGKNFINVLAVFGGFKLVVPEDWNIKIDAVSVFGGFTDKHRVHMPEAFTEDGPQLIIKGFLIFGGGEIKSY